MLETNKRDQIKKKIWAEELRYKFALVWLLLSFIAGVILFVLLWETGSIVTTPMFVIIAIVAAISAICHAFVFSHDTTMRTLELSLKAEEYHEQAQKLWIEDAKNDAEK